GRVPSPGSPPPAAGAPARPSAPAHSPSSSAAVAAAAWCPRVERHSLAGDGLRHRVVGQELHLDRVLGQRAGGDRTYALAFTRPVPGDACRTLLPLSSYARTSGLVARRRWHGSPLGTSRQAACRCHSAIGSQVSWAHRLPGPARPGAAGVRTSPTQTQTASFSRR